MFEWRTSHEEWRHRGTSVGRVVGVLEHHAAIRSGPEAVIRVDGERHRSDVRSHSYAPRGPRRC